MSSNSMNLGNQYPMCSFSKLSEKRIVWQIISVCNRKCEYCFCSNESFYSEDREPYKKREHIFKVATDLFAIGFRDIQITGGEPFIRKDIMEIVSDLSGLGFRIALSTNCDLVTEEQIDEMVRLKVRSINISLDSHKESENDLIRGSGSFKNVLRVIKKVSEKPIRVRVHTVINKNNRAEISNLIDFLYALGIRLHTISSSLPYLEKYDPVLSREILESRKKHTDMEIDAIRIPLSLEQTPNTWMACKESNGLLFVSNNGTLMPCNLMRNWKVRKEFNIYTSPFNEVSQYVEKITSQNNEIIYPPCVIS